MGDEHAATIDSVSIPEDEGCYLVVTEGERSYRVILPTDGELVVGRDEGVEVRLRDPGVSRRHARLVMTEDEARIVDLGSRNGLHINGERLPDRETRALRDRDVITLGRTAMVYYACAPVPDREYVVSLDELAAHAGEGPFTLIVLAEAGKAASPGGLPATLGRSELLRILGDSDLAAFDGREVIILSPTGRDHAEAARLVDQLGHATPVSAGYATGDDFPAVLSEAREAIRAGAGGSERSLGSTGSLRMLSLGERRVLLADATMLRAYKLIERLAQSELSVLIGGETGTGKEVAAAAVHYFSRRRDKPFVALNCASLPETLVESELFGYEKGAFSGANVAKPGRFETADGGTLFLDEVGELPLPTQAKLLRVLETRRLVRLGGTRERELDLRLVAATNRDLEAEVRAGRFREDLYFRVGAATVWLPPLRDRRLELVLLTETFLDEACQRAGRSTMTLSPVCRPILAAYHWPGNVRELRNAVEYAVAAASPTTASVLPRHLPERIRRGLPQSVPEREPVLEATPTGFRPIEDEVRDLEKARMQTALAAAGGNQTEAAKLIGMPRRTFIRKLKQYSLRSE